jgi:L-glyceraldehyde 3-phosphate reductase
MLPAISLGLWQNFGGVDGFDNARAMILRAFDLGVTHFDLANNYGPPPGSAEETLGRVLKSDLAPWRDELVVSTKAGHPMWDGPYGDWGSRKHLLASLDQSLRRMGLDYVDVFYHHRPDPETPLEESMGALATAVRQGKALYAAVSKYPPDLAARALAMLREMGCPCVLHQARYSMFAREPEAGLFQALAEHGVGAIVFSPLAQGLLTDKYLNGVPEGSRATKAWSFLKQDQVTDDKIGRARRLGELAGRRGQTLAQMALAWVLRRPEVASAIVGASRVEQIEDCVAATRNLAFAPEELTAIDAILGQA